jgi:polyisoprenoid-binding protein YceI
MKNPAHIILSLLLSVVLLSGFTYVSQQKSNSSVTFKIKNAGMTVDGAFEKFTSTIVYNKANPEKSSFKGTIEATSINTGINMRDNHLRKAEYFDVANYPNITFSSTSVKKLSDNKLEVTGNLTIKKTTKSVKLVVEVKTVSGKNIFSTSIGLNRRDYGVGGSSWTLADNLTVYLEIEE